MTEKNIQVTVSDQLKIDTEEILAKQGITLEEAIQALCKKIVARGELPEELQLTEEEEKKRFNRIIKKFQPRPLNTYEEIEAWLNEDE